MNQAIFTIGTDHKYQNLSTVILEDKHKGFARLITEIVLARSIELISEENNIEALKENNIEKSALQKIADQMGRLHLFTEASRSYRANNGMEQENNIRKSGFFKNLCEDEIHSKIEQSYRQREQYWLTKIIERDTWPVLHVCGANHAVEFNKLVHSQGFNGKLLFKDWSN